VGYFILTYHLDTVAFVLILMGVLLAAHLRLRRGTGSGFTFRAVAGMAAIIIVGIVLAMGSGQAENRRQQKTVSGFAPTYAHEMARRGLARISQDTPAGDSTYVSLIEDQIRWLKDNPTIADIYTFGHDAEGRIILLVDSETDYNHNGAIDEEREERTAIGEVYEEDNDLISQAFAGTAVFTPRPTTDRWGTWISTFVPVFDEQGKPFAVLGVDFDAGQYVRSILWHRAAMLIAAGMVGIIFVGTLAMMAALRGEMSKRAALQQQLIDASRKAGMADIATGVLHNVGNALNSVNVSASLIADKVRAPEIAELAQASELLRGHKDDLARYLTQDESGKHVPDYVAELAQFVGGQQKELDRELANLTQGIEHIKEIVRSQQQFAKPSSVAQDVDAAAVVQEAIDLTFNRSIPHGIEIIRDITAGGVAIDKHKVLQILVNLIGNARHAMEAESVHKRQLTIAVSHDSESGSIFWRVSDTGIGIALHNIASIFQHGFTTKKEGHGFGLHSCANAAAEMGGTLKVHSDGPGRGAAFTLEIPNGTRKEEVTP
jgi:signal transduction histidine kinase